MSTMPGTGADGPQESPALADGHPGLRAGVVVDLGRDGDRSLSTGAMEAEVAVAAGNAIGMTLDTETSTEADLADAE